MANLVNRQNGKNQAENIIDYLLTFESAQTWTASAGTGTAILDNTVNYWGTNSLKIENTAPTTDLELTNSVQSTVIDTGGKYQLSWFVRKDDALETYSGHIEIFKNAVSYNTQSFSFGGDGSDEYVNKDYNDVWVRFISNIELDFAKSDVVTFKIQLDGIVGYTDPSTTMWIDGLMLNLNERVNFMPPNYVPPVYNKTLQSSDVTIENLIVDTIGLSALSAAPSSASDTGTLGEVRIDTDYIYVCTATDTWKRVLIATW